MSCLLLLSREDAGFEELQWLPTGNLITCFVVLRTSFQYFSPWIGCNKDCPFFIRRRSSLRIKVLLHFRVDFGGRRLLLALTIADSFALVLGGVPATTWVCVRCRRLAVARDYTEFHIPMLCRSCRTKTTNENDSKTLQSVNVTTRVAPVNGCKSSPAWSIFIDFLCGHARLSLLSRGITEYTGPVIIYQARGVPQRPSLRPQPSRWVAHSCLTARIM
ncbi:hypothetical protein M405DRAFT_481261 [Rhizopogon salebrosus TDB-379]|nr:hypothetical protein M405DRAFT_481261 [Rhizopogon salebrosus TDB-379]